MSLARYIADHAGEIRAFEHRHACTVAERLRYIRTFAGVQYLSDGYAVTLNHLWYALESAEGPLVLIMGGRSRQPFSGLESPLPALIRQKVRVLVTFGECAQRIGGELGCYTESDHGVATVPDAVICAARHARPGETVLFAPGCSSFDAYDGWLHREEDFERCAWLLSTGNPTGEESREEKILAA